MTNKYDEIFDQSLLDEIREKFYFIEGDEFQPNRIFFENSGGSLRLKSVVKESSFINRFPDSSTRPNETAKYLMDTILRGKKNFKTFINATKGSIVTNYSASRIMFNITEAIIKNCPGTNVVTSVLDHPASHSSAKYYAKRYGKEFRECRANIETGSIDLEEILRNVDENTCLLSIIYASNITGAILDVDTIINELRTKYPDIFIVLDVVQHAPHGIIDFDGLKIDGLAIAPYKMFGNRGFGIGFVSDRVATLPHELIDGKGSNIWEIGSADASDFASFNKTFEYLYHLGSNFTDSNDDRDVIVAAMKNIDLQEKFLLQTILEGTDNEKGLRHIEGINVHFDNKNLKFRDLIVAISFDNMDCSSAVNKFSEDNYIVFERLATSPFSKRMLDAFNLNGIIRVSPMHFNTVEEIEGFLRVATKIAQM